MELAIASASACSAYCHLSTPANDGGDGTRSSSLSSSSVLLKSRRRRRMMKPAELRRRCYAVLKQQRTRLYILRRCVCMLLCWHEDDLSD
ncbi:hypothetical protein E2562_018748 [Oryza meyeriana var. granulata]|uniref:Uncharacterized protein n=1 Tax=Oryza meyeriana var. granulata TaxID=110450 RepID=A0A6G1EMU7_9ORYZ|nr:hypothetical protein E2562_018748 [Oryza meyeriana var. granulata]